MAYSWKGEPSFFPYVSEAGPPEYQEPKLLTAMPLGMNKAHPRQPLAYIEQLHGLVGATTLCTEKGTESLTH